MCQIWKFVVVLRTVHVCQSVQNYLYLTHTNANTEYTKVKTAVLCLLVPGLLFMLVESHSNSDNLYEMEIREEYYHSCPSVPGMKDTSKGSWPV